MMKKEQSQYEVINQLRLPLIILMTYAHSYCNIREGYNLLECGWDSYEILKLLVSQTLVIVAVPVFFVISGYLFFANVKKLTKDIYWQKIRRRLKTLLIPYIIWNLLMTIKLKYFYFSFFWKPANLPLWFLRDLMIVTLLTPIIYIGVKKLGWWIFVFLLPLYVTGIGAIQPEPNPYAACYFTLGAFMSIRKMDIIDTFSRYEKPSYLIFVTFGLLMILTYPTLAFPIFMLCFRLVGIPMVFCLANRILANTTQRISQTASNSSYFIYLAHYIFFLSFIDTAFFSLFGKSITSLCIHYLICPLLKSAIFVAVYHFYRKTIFIGRKVSHQ